MKTFPWIVVLLFSATSLISQSYDEDCPYETGIRLLDAIHQNGNTYQAQADYFRYYIYKTDSSGIKTLIHKHNDVSRSAFNGKFFVTGPNSWDLVLANIFETDVFYNDEIYVISKDSTDKVNSQLFTQEEFSDDDFGYVLDIDRYTDTYDILGTKGFVRLVFEGSPFQDSFSYRVTDSEKLGLASREHISGTYTWDVYSIFYFNGDDPIITFDDEIIDLAFDNDYNYVLFPDKVIKMDTMMEEILETLELPSWVGPAKQIEVDDDFFFIIHDKYLDRVVRYKKEDTELFGTLYKETDPDYLIEELRLSGEKVLTITGARNLADFLHIQDKKILLELDKRPELEIEIIESDLFIDSIDFLSGPISFSIYNSGTIAIDSSVISMKFAFSFYNKRYQRAINGPLLPGESITITDTLSEPFFNSAHLNFYIIAADRQPLRSLAIAEADFTSSTATIPEAQYSLYPNPLDNQNHNLSFDIPFAPSVIKIYDTNARLVFSEQLFEKEGTLDLAALSAGLYFVSIHNGGQVSTSKLVVH